jgi:hypothetical protein
MATGWAGEPRLLDPRLLDPRPDVPGGGHADGAAAAGGACARWADVAGDAGWAGVLVDRALADPARPAYLIVPPGLDPLPLLAEAVGLVPPRLRWHVTFSTRFADLPAGAACGWRCVADETPAAAAARRSPAGVLVLDLTRPSPAPDTPAADAARAGRVVAPGGA